MNRQRHIWIQIALNILAVAVTAFMVLCLSGVINIPIGNVGLWCPLLTMLIVFSCVIPQIVYKRNIEIEQAKNELEFAKMRYQIINENNDATIWEYDIKGNRLYMMVTEKNGESKLEEVHDYYETVIKSTVHPDNYGVIDEFIAELPTSENNKPYEFRARRTDGEYGWYLLTATKVFDDKGNLCKAILKTVNIDSEFARKEKLREKSKLDPVTGVCNRYSLEENITEILKQPTTRKTRHALAVISINDFSFINERRGTVYGNALLTELAALLGSILPRSSVIGRVGGDEFVAFIPNCTDDEELFRCSEKIANCIKYTISDENNNETAIKCSLGISFFPQHASAYEELFFKSDTALCAAKINKSEYCVYSEGMEDSVSDIGSQYDLMSDVRSESGFYSDDLMNKIIEILFDSRDLSSSISIILSLIGHRYSLDHAYIFEFSDDFTYADMSYEWSSEKANSPAITTKHIPMELADKITLCIDSDHYASDDLTQDYRNDSQIVEFYDSLGAKSLLQCTILDNGACRGHINFCANESGHTWSKLDINELLLISKIIGGYLVRLRTQQDVDRASYYDRLTGAWNLTRFITECDSLLSRYPDTKYCIVYSDIDRFKFINEKYGFTIGNELLIRFAQTLGSSINENEAYARANADRFVSILEYKDDEDLKRRMNSFNQQINAIKKDDSSYYKISVRSGVYIIPDERDDDVTTYIDNALIACNSIDIVHKSIYAYFDESMKKTLSKQQEIEDVMQDALDAGEFVVYYQPKFSLANRDLVGAEALVRWNRPGIGVVPPSEFIPLFEDNEFIVKIDFFVLESVCKKLASDIKDGLPVTPISVNFSRVHLRSPHFIDKIRECIETYNIPSNLIEIEITESAMTGNEDYLLEIMKSLHRLGIVISMDDFGSGYSSLNLLKKLPFDVLKIDKEFFAGGGGYDRERERTIIANVVNMAKSLNIRVVSEGVETNDQVDFLKEIKCDQAQGYYYAKPMDVESYRSRYQRAAVNAEVM